MAQRVRHRRGRCLYARGPIGGHEGNVSVRLDASILITPPAWARAFLTPDMIVRTDLEGVRRTEGAPPRETLMHTAGLPAARADVRGRARPPADGDGVRGGRHRPRPPTHRGSGGDARRAPVIPYGQPSTEELADNVGQAISRRAGAADGEPRRVAGGDTLEQAWERMETLEQLARVTLVTRLLGTRSPRPGAESGRLEESRTRLGLPAARVRPRVRRAGGGRARRWRVSPAAPSP